MDNSDKLLEMIKAQGVKPIPRWRFLLRNALFWLIFTFAILFGALAFSIILFAIQQVDFNLTGHLAHSAFESALSLVPVIWIVSLLVFLVFAFIGIKNSRKGYKFTSFSLVGFATALSILAGTLFFISGGAKWLENEFEDQVIIYESVEERKLDVWSRPGEGYLSGTIISEGEDEIELKDFKGNIWKVDFRSADIVPAVRMNEGEKIKMTGKVLSEGMFKADMIRPWGGMQHRHRGN